MKSSTAILIGFALLLAHPFALQAQIPRTLSYQGIVTDAVGELKPDGSYSFTFRLYDAFSGGTALWTESKTISVKDGLFFTTLGDQVIFPTSLRFDKPYWLGIQVASEDELSPRVPLTSVGYSFAALRADSAQYAVRADSATAFSGSGSSLTNLNASNLTSGAIANTLLDANLQDLADGLLTGSKVGSGISASNITTGILSDSRLETTIDRTGFNASGNITAANFNYSSAKTKYKAIAAAAFIPASSTLSWTLHATVGTYIYLSSGQSMYANVDLPDGVTVTELTAWLYDNHATAYVAVYLRRQPLNSPDFNQNDLASVATTAEEASLSVLERNDATIANAIVDNSLYKYSLKFYSPSANIAGSDARLYSVRIKYTTNSPL